MTEERKNVQFSFKQRNIKMMVASVVDRAHAVSERI